MLDNLEWDALVAELGEPDHIATVMREGGRCWQPGQPKPVLANSDPAVTQAMARCLCSRLAHGTSGDFGAVLNSMVIHPKVCNFCDYPTEQLEAAVDWAGWESSLTEIEYATWRGRDRSTYSRGTLRQGAYGNPRWANFFSEAPSRKDASAYRTRAIDAVMYGQPE